MNWKTAFFVCVIALGGSLFWGLNQPAHDCSKCTCAASPPDMINGDSAAVAKNLYTKFRSNIAVTRTGKSVIGDGRDSVEVDVLAQQLKQVRGFQLRHCELSEMLLEQGPGAEVWAMLCVRPQLKKPRNKTDWEVDLLFQVRTAGPPDEARPGDTFYDFTDPCPTSCP